jgi:hypothetical protein
MEGRFGWRYFSVQPTKQLGVELGGRFAFDSRTLAEGFGPALQFGPSFGRLLQLVQRRLQFSQLLLDQFLDQQSLLLALVLERDFVALPIRFSAAVHAASFISAVIVASRSSQVNAEKGDILIFGSLAAPSKKRNVSFSSPHPHGF